MCDKCEKLDKKIEHYETIVVSIGDRATVERLMARRFTGAKGGASSRAKAVRPPHLAASFFGLFRGFCS